jgi:hypothetical protein
MLTTEAWTLKIKLWRICRPVAPELHPFDEKKDPDPDMHQSVKTSDPDPRQSVKKIRITVESTTEC